MSTTEAATTTTQTKKHLRPARKQVKPGQVVKNEVPQTGKEYSEYNITNMSYSLST